MSHPLLEGLDGLTGVALRQRLVDARAAALAAAAGDKSHPVAALVRDVEDKVVRAMREGIVSLVQVMQPATSPVPVPTPALAPVPVPRPPMICVPAPAAAKAPALVPAPRPPTPGRLAGLRKAAPADDGPPEAPEAPEPVPRHPPLRPNLPPVQPIHPSYRLPVGPPIDPNDDAIPW